MLQIRLFGVAALCALAATAALSSIAAADAPRRRSLARCTSFEQRDKDEVTIELTVRNTCTMPIDCKLSWNVICAPESRKRRKVETGGATFTVGTQASQAAEASASTCGDDSWVIKDVTWRCEPTKD